MTDISVKYMGLDLPSPLIAASSGLTDNIPNLERFQEQGVGAVVLKSLFEEEIRIHNDLSLSKMTSSGFIYPETLEFYDYHDDAVQEATLKYLELVKKAKSKLSIPVIPSINCVTSEVWTSYLPELENAGADAIELNVFIIPSDLNRGRTENERTYFNIINEVISRLKIPVALKVSFYFSDLAIMLKKFSESGIKGLVLFNRFYNPDIDLEMMEVTSSNVLSTPQDMSNVLRWVAIMHDHVKCDISATTGIHDGKAMIKMLLAGASNVQVASAFYKNGVDYASEMLEELKTWMQQKSYSRIDDFRGLLSQHGSGNPAAYQRVQFMKYFRGHK
jgi:dihydroorotate dehydrogenase (fumarate)